MSEPVEETRGFSTVCLEQGEASIQIFKSSSPKNSNEAAPTDIRQYFQSAEPVTEPAAATFFDSLTPMSPPPQTPAPLCQLFSDEVGGGDMEGKAFFDTIANAKLNIGAEVPATSPPLLPSPPPPEDCLTSNLWIPSSKTQEIIDRATAVPGFVPDRNCLTLAKLKFTGSLCCYHLQTKVPNESEKHSEILSEDGNNNLTETHPANGNLFTKDSLHLQNYHFYNLETLRCCPLQGGSSTVFSNSPKDSIAQALQQNGLDEALRTRKVLTADMVSQDPAGIKQLISAGSYIAAVDLIGRLLTLQGQGISADSPVRHTPYTLQVYLSLLLHTFKY
ncbi:TRAPPC12 [Cordylochernes scorpioides]|uniref:TRAPPC12 n=1 Tax=Cordylochernes scorpioides TaxID=51811 RepID=A0ABY6K7S6_9ARAC|nr:TRAPPC12 [Cordylochernes scorpioides]